MSNTLMDNLLIIYIYINNFHFAAQVLRAGRLWCGALLRGGVLLPDLGGSLLQVWNLPSGSAKKLNESVTMI